MGKTAGWMKKEAGEDWMVNPDYTKQIAEELTNRGNQIISYDQYKIVTNYKIQDKVLNNLSIKVFEGSYEGFFILQPFTSKGSQLAIIDGKTAQEALDNMDGFIFTNFFGNILNEYSKNQKPKTSV